MGKKVKILEDDLSDLPEEPSKEQDLIWDQEEPIDNQTFLKCINEID